MQTSERNVFLDHHLNKLEFVRCHKIVDEIQKEGHHSLQELFVVTLLVH